MRRSITAFSLVTLLASTFACLNDQDTLGFELANKPDIQKALTGRFDRYPAKYYEMRIDRLNAKSSLTALEYDDLAVAYARLGKNDEGLKALQLKAKLPNLTKDDKYRLYANKGTLEAHKWIHDGAKKSDLKLIKQAEQDIAKAIQINSKAHFGREGVQLETIRWLIDLKSDKPSNMTLGIWLNDRFDDGDPSEALAGLIMLGGAWESPDVAFAIGEMNESDGGGIDSLALARYDDLIRQGKKSFAGKLTTKDAEELRVIVIRGEPYRNEPISKRYLRLRKEANDWLAHKTEYMLSQFKLGKHPDTDPHFWDGYSEKVMPKLPTVDPKKREVQDRQRQFWPATVVTLAIGIIGAPVGLVLLVVKLVRRARKARTNVV